MTAVALLENFARIAEVPDAVGRLRRFVLDLAVRGKLVPQDPNDEPASELLKRIEATKQYQKSGRIRQRHPTGKISTEEVGVDLPTGWQWARAAEVCDVRDGTHDTPRYVESGVPLVTSKNLRDGILNLANVKYISSADHEEISRRSLVEKGDVLFAMIGTIGNPVVVEDQLPFSIKNVALFKCYSQLDSSPEYLRLLLRHFEDVMTAQAAGGLQPFVPLKTLRGFPIPLPPLAEQHRIVAKVDELMTLCGELEATQAKRESRRDRLVAATLHGLNNGGTKPEDQRHTARFYFNHLPRLTTRPEHIRQLRQTILNLAVRGKLVPQAPNDEPASSLIDRIREERSQTEKRRLKLPPPIDSSETPFSLPAGWAWGSFPELGLFGRGKSKHRPRNDPSLFENGTHPLVQTGDVARANGVIRTSTNQYNERGLAQSAKWPEGTLCITIAANIADTGILGSDACFPDSVVGFVPAPPFPNARYFEYFMRTAQANLLKFAPATAQKNINLSVLTKLLIPLPPLAEQQRIVAKADELMALCNDLEAHLTDAADTRHALLKATLNEALAST